MKAHFPIEVTEEGIDTCVSDEQLSKAKHLIILINEGIFTTLKVDFVQTRIS